MSWILLSLAVISLTEGISYGQDQCPEENRGRHRPTDELLPRVKNFHWYSTYKMATEEP